MIVIVSSGFLKRHLSIKGPQFTIVDDYNYIESDRDHGVLLIANNTVYCIDCIQFHVCFLERNHTKLLRDIFYYLQSQNISYFLKVLFYS